MSQLNSPNIYCKVVSQLYFKYLLYTYIIVLAQLNSPNIYCKVVFSYISNILNYILI